MDDFFDTHDQDDLADWEAEQVFQDDEGDWGDEDAGMEAGLFGDC